MTGYFLKNPGSTLDYTFDWGFQLLDDGETISSDLGWTIHPDAQASGGLSISSTSSSLTTTTAFLAGGRPGETYLICSRVQTTSGREVQRSMTVRVANN
ncbi:MAG: hypothetical protein AAF557_07090 [Pseudomonadota bacterium]